ncbi:MAG: hypothetical protein IKW98_00395 [Prevotella sp.]|nr:hypothetical protein [Prevotella sp.]
MKKNLINWMTIFMVAIMSVSFMSCSSDDDDNAVVIPSGTYIEENGDEGELFTLVVNGNNVRWTCTVYGKVESVVDYTYTINGNQITLVSSKYGKETLYFNQKGNRITIGEITYIKQ